MTARIYFVRCLAEDCEWRGSRRTESVVPCPWCDGAVELYEPRHRMAAQSASEMGIVRPALARAPFGIPTSAPRMRPWHDGTRILPNGLRAKVVRLPSVADAIDHENRQGSDLAAEVLSYQGWGGKFS